MTQAGFLGQKDSETSQGVQNTLPASAPLPKADNQHAASLVCSPRAASPPSGSMSGTRTTSHDPTYPQVKYHLGFAIADKLMGILRVKNHKILKLKGDNCINAKLSNAFCLLFHSKHLVLSQTHFTTCTELKTETKFPVKDKRCSPSSEWGQTRRTKSFPAMRLGRSRAAWGTSHHGPSASHGWWQQRSISNSPKMLHCIGVQKGWDKILPHISPSIHQHPRTGWGCQGGPGEDRAAQSRSSASLICCHSPDTQTQASALCCTGVSLWAKSTSKHRLSGREGKTKGHLWLSGILERPGEPHSLQLQEGTR